jgi:hypothetical protein
MMNPITYEYFSSLIIHPDGNRDDQCAPRIPQPLVDIGVELKTSRHPIELGDGGTVQGRLEVRCLSHGYLSRSRKSGLTGR